MTTLTGRISMITLGCPKNTVDSEVMLGNLVGEGFEVVDDPRFADIVIVNTCGFIEAAKAESIETILEAARLKRRGVRGVLVTGCLAQRYGEELAEELPEADGIIGFAGYGDLGKRVRELLTRNESNGRRRVDVGDATVPFRPEWGRKRLTPRHSAYLRVAEGCDHKCTFCAIPSFRGRFRSKPWDELLEEVRVLADSGVRELNLIAEDTNQYGQDVRGDDRNLADLLAAVADVSGIEWIRILYAYPSYFGDDLIDAIATIPEVCKYIDMPLQHIADPVLRRMRRPPKGKTVQLIEKLRERIPDLVLRTTFISGFPGETEADHEELLTFIQDHPFERLGVFAYSVEDGTPAADFTDQIPDEVRWRRRDEIMAVQQDIAFEFAARQEGKTLPVLVDGIDAGVPTGRTTMDAPDVDPVVRILESDRELEPGTLLPVKIIRSADYDLEGDARQAN